MMIVGTAHFVNRQAAIAYYRAYGFTPADVDKKITDDEIHIGKPSLQYGERLGLTDGGRRYTIITGDED